ncbi:MAG: hypothetical protein WCG26_11390 [Chloroflexales bacterium]
MVYHTFHVEIDLTERELKAVTRAVASTATSLAEQGLDVQWSIRSELGAQLHRALLALMRAQHDRDNAAALTRRLQIVTTPQYTPVEMPDWLKDGQ